MLADDAASGTTNGAGVATGAAVGNGAAVANGARATNGAVSHAATAAVNGAVTAAADNAGHPSGARAVTDASNGAGAADGAVPSVAELRQRFPRVAISHEWLTIPGGSEKVVMALLELFPHAEIFTSIYDPAPWPPAINSRPVHVSFLDRVPGARSAYPRLLPMMNAAFESFDLSGFDLVISSNHACAKNVRTAAGTPHVCYCHTPMRYAWEPGFLGGESLGTLSRALLPAVAAHLRRTDLVAAQRPDRFIANSHHVAARIARYYGREADVVHPPIDVAPLLGRRRDPQDYYLALGRVVPYKRVDAAVAACERLGRPIKVAGEGRGLDAVRAVAGPNTELLGYVDDDTAIELLAGARALLFPGEEDFGMVPVEAQAAGTPVIAYGVGGARETVIDGRTGVLYDDPTVDGLCQAILAFEQLSFDDAALRENAARFGPERFRRAVAGLVIDAANNVGAAANTVGAAS